MSKKSSLSLQCWVEKYLQAGGSSFFSYLGAKADERGEVDGLLIMFSAIVLDRVITIISNSGVWSTDNTINHDIVLIHKGGNIFLHTDIYLENMCLSVSCIRRKGIELITYIIIPISSSSWTWIRYPVGIRKY